MAVCQAALDPPDGEDGFSLFPQYCDTLTQRNLSMNQTLATNDDPVGSLKSSLNYVVSGLFSANNSMCVYNQSTFDSFAVFPGAVEYHCDPECVMFGENLTFLYSTWGYYDGCNATKTESWYCNGYGGARCSLRPCIQTYTASIEAGILAEALVEQSDVDAPWTLTSTPLPGASYFSLIDLSLVGADLEKELLSAGYAVIETDRWMGFNLTEDPQANTSGSLQKSLFDTGALFAVQFDFFASLMASAAAPLEETSATGGSALSQLLANETTLGAKSIGDTMGNVAKAITLAIRSNGFSGYSNPALGTVYDYAICVRVNWEWFAFPAILGALTICLLALTIVNTVRYELPVWKSFPLTTLFNGPSGKEWVDETQILGSLDAEISVQSLSTQDGMEKLAGKVSVRLVKMDDGGHQLIQVLSKCQ
ncbi:hypothetical protein N0V82_003579 [Gnomoniopsis sp. IMI 355080]|nr:hypothetical protein N0V82_003579 [Gnomoniopsis sp. IMI 355080]